MLVLWNFYSMKAIRFRFYHDLSTFSCRTNVDVFSVRFVEHARFNDTSTYTTSSDPTEVNMMVKHIKSEMNVRRIPGLAHRSFNCRPY
jgi:hypothetical protein